MTFLRGIIYAAAFRRKVKFISNQCPSQPEACQQCDTFNAGHVPACEPLLTAMRTDSHWKRKLVIQANGLCHLSQNQKTPPQAIRPVTFNLGVQGRYNSIGLFKPGGKESGVERKAPHYPHITTCSADGLATIGDCGNPSATLPSACLQKSSPSASECLLFVLHPHRVNSHCSSFGMCQVFKSSYCLFVLVLGRFFPDIYFEKN